MIKHGVPIWRKIFNNTAVIRVGVQRVIDETNINLSELWQQDLQKNLIHNPKDFIILNTSVRSVSSSLIRIHLSQWFDAKEDSEKQKEIEDYLVNLNSFLHLSSMNYIKEHQDDLYISK